MTACATRKPTPEVDAVPADQPSIKADEQAQAQARLREDANLRRQQSTAQNTSSISMPAVIALRGQADAASVSGDSRTANLLLERALRIDASDPSTYLQLARLRLANQKYTQAGALARKGLSLNPPESVKTPLQKILLQARNPGVSNANT